MTVLTRKMTFDTIDYASSKRTMTPEGYMSVKDCKVARTGVQQYMASELGLTQDGSADRVVGVYRPADEVFSADSLASFEGKPITVDHPSEFVTAANWKQLAHGHMSNVRRAGNDMVADLLITDAAAVAAIKNGKAQLSNGYEHEIDWAPGSCDGQGYVAVQRNIVGNHIACVDQARAGPDYRVADQTPKKELIMSIDNAPAVKLSRMTVDGVSVEVNDAAALVIDGLQKKLTASVADLDKAKTAGEASAKTIADQAKEIETLKANQLTDAALADITLAVDQAKKISPETAVSGTNPAEIRRTAIAAAHAGKRKGVIDAALCGVELAKAEGPALKMIAGVLAADGAATDATKTDGGGFKLPLVTQDSNAGFGQAKDAAFDDGSYLGFASRFHTA